MINRSSKSQPNQSKMNPFVALLVGVLLFIGAFPVLFVNESQENLASVAKKAVEYEPSLENNTFVYTVGSITATNYAVDELLTKNFIYVSRTVEMYGYQESQETVNSQDRYRYTPGWLVNPPVTTAWLGTINEQPQNIPTDYNLWISNLPQRQTTTATDLEINGITLDQNQLSFSGEQELVLNEADIENDEFSIQNNYLYFSNQLSGTATNPLIGDIRVSFSVIELSDEGLVLGWFNNGQIEAYTTNNNNLIYRYFNGETSIRSVVSLLQSEYELSLWIFRGVGFLMLFVGLLLVLKPLMSVLNVIPFFGDLGNFLLMLMSFGVSLLLTVITIILSLIVQNLLIVMSVSVVLFGLFFFLIRKPKKKIITSA
jgi:hypothetical protein